MLSSGPRDKKGPRTGCSANLGDAPLRSGKTGAGKEKAVQPLKPLRFCIKRARNQKGPIVRTRGQGSFLRRQKHFAGKKSRGTEGAECKRTRRRDPQLRDWLNSLRGPGEKSRRKIQKHHFLRRERTGETPERKKETIDHGMAREGTYRSILHAVQEGEGGLGRLNSPASTLSARTLVSTGKRKLTGELHEGELGGRVENR